MKTLKATIKSNISSGTFPLSFERLSYRAGAFIMRGGKMTNQEIQAEALVRAETGQTFSNYPAIFRGFMAKGIPEQDIEPRVNVLTFQAWKAKGRYVRKGEHGVKVLTYIPTETEEKKEDGSKEIKYGSRPWAATVFHISQTEEVIK